MTITIELTPEKEAALREKGRPARKDAAAYVAALVEQDIDEAADSAERPLSELLEGLTGVVKSGGNLRLSENCGEQFADYLVEKRRRGHL